MNEVSICNAALSYLGEVGNVVTIDPPDGTPFSESCSIYYPMALRYLLELHNWSFATRRVQLAEVAKFDKKFWQWEHGFLMPADFVRVIGVFELGSALDDGSVDFQIESTEGDGGYILLTDAKQPVLRYVSTIKNISLVPNYFVQALIVQTASYLTGPIMKTSMINDLLKMAERALENAKYLDNKNSIRHKREYLAPHLKARSI